MVILIAHKFLMIKGPVHKEDTKLEVYVPKNSFSIYKEKTKKTDRLMQSSNWRRSHSSLSNRMSVQKVSKNTEELQSTTNQLKLMDTEHSTH